MDNVSVILCHCHNYTVMAMSVMGRDVATLRVGAWRSGYIIGILQIHGARRKKFIALRVGWQFDVECQHVNM
jgi:hypothetical protein